MTGSTRFDFTLIDGTLREGEQSAGVFFTAFEKTNLLRLMDGAGIGIADCGMPAVSKEEFEAIKKLVRARRNENLNIRVGASIRCRADEITLFAKTGADDCFLITPASDIHISEKFGLSKEKYISYIEKNLEETGKAGIKYVHMVLEDITRADMKFVQKLVKKAERFDIAAYYACDTIGIALPEKMSAIVNTLGESAGNAAKIGVHCHDDFGLALANTLAAIDSGAKFLTFTQNGIGERCGNVKFHELILALTRLKGARIKTDYGLISEISKTVEKMSGIFMQATEPFVGYNAFRHESGIHVAGLLKNRKIYEEFKAEDVEKKNEFVLGKHSGKAIIDALLAESFKGVEFSAAEKNEILRLVKENRVGSSKKEIVKMQERLIKFYDKMLGGLSTAEFKKIANRVKNEEKKKRL